MNTIRIIKIEEASTPKKGKAFLLPGKFSPYTIGHHEVARQAAAHAAQHGYTHFYHGIGGASKQTEKDPFTHAEKTKVIRSAHKELAKEHPNVKFKTTKREQLGPFHQLTHLAKQGHKHITVAVSVGHKLRKDIGDWVSKNNGIKDETGKVHPVKVDFHDLGKERQEGEMPRHEVLSKLRSGDIRSAKATRLRHAVASGDTELAHELMPKHMNKPKYFGMIKKAQSRLKKKVVKEGYMSFAEFVAEDIELIPVHRDQKAEKPRKADVVHKDYGSKTYSSDKVVKRKNHGEIHPGYELHQHSVEIDSNRHGRANRVVKHKFTIVHKATGDIAGEMHAWGGKLHPKKGVVPGPKGKGLKVTHLEIHPNHTSKKVGKSLPVEMYRHLHRSGHAIQSDKVQSHGAANVWNTMRNDRELRKHMMIHDDDKTDTKQKHAFQTRAHTRPERHIWTQFSRRWSEDRGHRSKVEPEYGVDPDFSRTLILSGKKRKKVNEAPEIDPYIEPGETKKERFNVSYLKKKKETYAGFRGHGPQEERKFVGHKRMGDIHPDYELWKHTTKMTDRKGNAHHQHQFSIVHKKTREKVGEIDAQGGRINRITGEHTPSTKGKGLRIQYVGIHPDHSASTIGTSLAVAAYKHLHSKGHSIKSDTRHSFGGAHVWDKLRKDPDVKHHVKFHDERDNRGTPAHKLSYGAIWQEHPSARETTLVLHAKKKKPAVVSEDIEMANILSKPHGGYHRDFAKMIVAKGINPKKSGRIAKGYTLYTTKDEKNPEIEDHHIVHDETGHVAGEIATRTSGNDHTVIHTDIHGDHTQKKIGKSLAILAYKHLARKKGNLHSSSLQSPGGASIWQRIRKDPKMKGQVFHKMRGSPEVPAHDLPDKKVWATEVSGGMSSKNKNIPKPLPPSKHHAAEHGNVMGSRLVIRPTKKS